MNPGTFDPNPKPRTPLTWPDTVAVLGALALILGAVCFIVWTVTT